MVESGSNVAERGTRFEAWGLAANLIRARRTLVPGTGLEPAHLTARASKTLVSAIPPPGRVVLLQLRNAPAHSASAESSPRPTSSRAPYGPTTNR